MHGCFQKSPVLGRLDISLRDLKTDPSIASKEPRIPSFFMVMKGSYRGYVRVIGGFFKDLKRLSEWPQVM